MAKISPISEKMRNPALVMRLSRLGSMHQSRLSFMRVLTRRMALDAWSFSRIAFDFDDHGVGHAVYTATGPDRSYSLIAFGHDLPAEDRSDRVIATAWDATFSLFDGVPTSADIDRLAKNIPFQEAGRVSEKEISVSRANRSVRLWDHFVEALSQGRQPKKEIVDAVGYLMRTTAVDGSGKLGAADYETISDRPEFRTPFQAELLSVYLTRTFVRDLVQHMARAKGGSSAVDLDPRIARTLGIGNSTGLGLAPFVINHPLLFNNWIAAREMAIARVRSIEISAEAEAAMFQDLLRRSEISALNWRSDHPIQIDKIAELRRDIQAIKNHVAQDGLRENYPWDRLMHWSETALGAEGQEMLASLLLEPYGDLVDSLADGMSDRDPTPVPINGSMTINDVRNLIRGHFNWALKMDWGAPENCARAWYVSEQKLEPRLGERFEETIEDYEQPLATGRDAAFAFSELSKWDGEKPIAEFLALHPEHRHTVRRAQLTEAAPFSEIRDNTIAAEMLPIDFLRAKLAFFGATHFDPRSDRWVRICMFANAPYPEELNQGNSDLWVYPEATP